MELMIMCEEQVSFCLCPTFTNRRLPEAPAASGRAAGGPRSRKHAAAEDEREREEEMDINEQRMKIMFKQVMVEKKLT